MTISLLFKSIACLTLILASAPAHAQEMIVGLWGFGGCDDASNIEYQGYTLAAYSGDNGIEIISQEITPISGSDWLYVRTDQLDPAPSLMREKDGFLEQAWPKTEPNTTAEIEALHASLSSGALTPEVVPEAFNIDRGETCPSLPLPQSLVMGEALAVLKELDAAVSDCREAVARCPGNLFRVADVSGDGELSVAEIARIIRASVSIGTVMDTKVSQGQRVVAASSAAALAPIASGAIMHSFDYDRSGSLSFDELLSERLPAEFSETEKMRFDVSSWVKAISDGAKTAAGAGAMLLQK